MTVAVADTDAELESRLTALSLRLWNERDPEKHKLLMQEFRALHAQRSPEKVRRMDLEQGLCR